MAASVAFFDGSRGILVGTTKARGRACPAHMRCPPIKGTRTVRKGTPIGIIAITADRGATWRATSYAPGRAFGSVAVRGHDAWVSFGRCAFQRCPRGLLFSADRGRTWRRISTAPVLDASFGSRRRGWALLAKRGSGGLARLASTSDGGRTWRKRDDPCPRALAPVSLSFIDPRTGWLLCVGEPATDMQAKALFTTGDGGRTWRAVAETFPPGRRATVPSGGLPMTGYFPGIFFASRTRGWMWASRGVLSATTDGGATWRQKSRVISPDVTNMGSAWFVSDTVGYALLYKEGRSHLIHTRDAGVTWTTVRIW